MVEQYQATTTLAAADPSLSLSNQPPHPHQAQAQLPSQSHDNNNTTTSTNSQLSLLLSQTALISHVSQSERESEWIKKYSLDIHLFKSPTVYNLQIISEMKELTSPDSGDFNKNILASLLAHLLTEVEAHLPPSKMYNNEQNAHSLNTLQYSITQLIKSVFVLGSNSAATNPSSGEIFNRNKLRRRKTTAADNIWALETSPGCSGGGGSGSKNSLAAHNEDIVNQDSNLKKRFQTFLQVPTWMEACEYWKARCDKENSLIPYLTRLKNKMTREREIEDRVLNHACTVWTRPLIAIVFDSWSGDVGSDRKLQILGSALFRLTEIKPSQIFAVWKKFTYKSKKSKQVDVLANLMQEIENVKKLLKECQTRCMKKNAELTKLKKINANIEKKLNEVRRSCEERSDESDDEEIYDIYQARRTLHRYATGWK